MVFLTTNEEEEVAIEETEVTVEKVVKDVWDEEGD